MKSGAIGEAKIHLIPAQKRFFAEIIGNYPNTKVDIIGTKKGFEILLKTPAESVYILHTQRKAVRHFKSPSTLFSFLADIGATNIKVKNLHLCPPDRYVRLNKGRHDRRLKADKIKREP